MHGGVVGFFWGGFWVFFLCHSYMAERAWRCFIAIVCTHTEQIGVGLGNPYAADVSNIIVTWGKTNTALQLHHLDGMYHT